MTQTLTTSIFGDELGILGTLLTYPVWKNVAQGHWRIGTTHHVALVVESK